MEALANYLTRLTAAAMLTAAASALTPKGKLRRVTAFVGGLVLLFAAVSPLTGFDYENLASYVSRLELQTDAAASGVTVTNRDLVATIISRKTETYILDKAAELGAEISVSVQTDEDGDWPYPVSVTIRGQVTQAQKQTLSSYIMAELAIPAERQEWLSM